jgi:2-oxoglutarate ferredoxin oxidoreductase subunit beta
MIAIQHGKPLIFGKDKNKGLMLKGTRLEVVQIGNGITESDLLVYNEEDENPTMAYLLSGMSYPDFPVPMGVFRKVQKPPYDQLLQKQVERSVEALGPGNIEKLWHSGDTWVVE